MKCRLTLTVGLGAIFLARVAAAQEVSIGYQGLPYKSSKDSTNGIQVSDGVLLHVGAGAEAGYDTNVFYQDTNPVGSFITRITAFGEITNATRTGASPSGLSFDARAGLMYRRYESSDSKLDGYKNAFMPSAGISLGTSLGPTVSFGFADAFVRTEDAPYNPGQPPIQRDNNQASAEARWAPGGGRISTVLRYTNMVDIFQDNTYSYADALTQELMVDAAWKWLPKTAAFAQARAGWVTYLNTNGSTVNSQAPPKYTSFPLHLTVGLRGLITEKTSAIVAVGYANAFYSCTTGTTACVSTSGFVGSTYANIELTYRPTLLARIVAGWRQDFQNSVISTFYYGEQVYASYVQQIASRAVLDISGSYQHKNYQGFVVNQNGMAVVQPRIDNVYQVGVTGDYLLRNWAYVGIGYQLVANVSDYAIAAPATAAAGSPSNSVNYVKSQVFARLGVTY
jgi:hypothetical protein